MGDLYQLFQETADRYAGHAAIKEKGKTMTYRQLEDKVSDIAKQLGLHGVAFGDNIIVHMPNSLDAVACTLAILKLGCVVVPLSQETPAAKVLAIARDCGACFIISEAHRQIEQPGFKVLSCSDLAAVSTGNKSGQKLSAQANEIAYCIYTSGSTGEPKGVLLTQEGILNQIRAKSALLKISSETVMCQSLNLGFVASIWQIWCPLLAGAFLIVYDEFIIRNPTDLLKAVSKDHVEIVTMLPQLLSAYCKLLKNGHEPVDLPDLRVVVMTGEKLPGVLVSDFYRYYHIPIVNAYGQSECSDDTFHYLVPFGFEGTHVPIGTPIEHIQAYILDEDLQEVSPGESGELCISGVCLAAGYIHEGPDAFFIHPAEKVRCYKTGDIVKKLSTGEYVCFGRKDNMLKVRGFRVQPEEIENKLEECPGISKAIVLPVQENEYTVDLRAYCIPETTVNEAEIRMLLSSQLPPYMLPRDYSFLEKLPLTPNGKVDRTALKDMGKAVQPGAADTAEAAAVQDMVIDIVSSNAQKVTALDMNSKLGDLGLDSISFINVVVALEESFDFMFGDEMLAFDEEKTMADLVLYIQETQQKQLKL